MDVEYADDDCFCCCDFQYSNYNRIDFLGPAAGKKISFGHHPSADVVFDGGDDAMPDDRHLRHDA